jgi:hypothetical protein
MPNDIYAGIKWTAGAAPKSPAEQASENMARELQRSTAVGRLSLPEVRDLIAKLVELGWKAP